MDQAIVKTHSKYLFDLTIEADKVLEYEREAVISTEVLRSDKALMKVFNHPAISESRKVTLVLNTFEGQLSKTFLDFFKKVISEGHEAHLLDIFENFLDEILEHKGTAIVEVVSAVELTEEQLESIKDRLSENLKKQVELDVRIDPSIIAGFKVRIDDHVVDGTAKTQMADIKNSIYNMKMD